MRNSLENFILRESEIVINHYYPFMGAKPDCVASCDCCGEMLLEIKCPFCAKDSPVSNSVSCLETVDGQLKLKTTLIDCDNSNCPYVWLHFKCVKLKKVLNGDWYYPVCRKLSQFKIK
ncbi:hypothetical protein ACJMK2_014337 [Sinanodonta woodiana]|uniref:YqaJ viral recombinase domain-containing protein n=1 Tax=Sinanodonta woodiana TaxID=1069815 RepID=A0ABD3V3A5_SINWO